MIKNLNDINEINLFLNKFDTQVSDINDPFKKYIGYEINGEIISFLNYSLIYDRIEIEYIYIKDEYRNQGIASILLNYLVELGQKIDCLNITLEVRLSNESAIKFYEKNGFKKVSTRKNYYKEEDGILMLRELV